jgi:hypothetical protein
MKKYRLGGLLKVLRTLSTCVFVLAFSAIPAFATSHPSKSEEPVTYDDALKMENAYLGELQKNPDIAQVYSDDSYLEVIDKADKAGRAVGLAPEIRERLEKYRKEQETDDALEKAPWQHGPASIKLAGPATLQLPKGYKYLAPADADHVRVVSGLAASDRPMAMLASEEDAPDPWAGNLDFENTGHFTSNQLMVDPEAFLKALNDNKDPMAEVQKIGSGAYPLDSDTGWLQQPHMDLATSTFSASHGNSEDPLGNDQGTVIVFGRRWAVGERRRDRAFLTFYSVEKD